MLKIFKYPRYVFIVLVISFIVYNISIYCIPIYDGTDASTSKNIALGKEIWQQNNCHTCHQLYGLGGYLGPDLTNMFAKPNYNKEYVKNVIKNGMLQMPAFNLTDKQIEDVLVFLEAANEAGSAKPMDYETTYYGTFNKKNE